MRSYITQQKGIIMGVSSTAGYRGLPGRSGYSLPSCRDGSIKTVLKTVSM
jgi:hypothetical protein